MDAKMLLLSLLVASLMTFVTSNPSTRDVDCGENGVAFTSDIVGRAFNEIPSEMLTSLVDGELDITISGTVNASGSDSFRFIISLREEVTNFNVRPFNLAFRFDTGGASSDEIVLNYKEENGSWHTPTIKKDEPQLQLTKGATFTVKISVKSDEYQVTVNGESVDPMNRGIALDNIKYVVLVGYNFVENVCIEYQTV